MTTAYNTDVVAWANEQAALIRAKRFDLLDLENIAEEIEDVGKSEKRELASRMAVLLAHLLKWQYQSGFRGASWQSTIHNQRSQIARAIKETPSLKPLLSNEEWFSGTWGDAVSAASKETGLPIFPSECLWSISEILLDGWYPPEIEFNQLHS